MASLLESNYIIDGVQHNLSPGRMLRECCADAPVEPEPDQEVIADEHLDPAPDNFTFDEKKTGEYAQAVKDAGKRAFPIEFAGPVTIAQVAQALIDAIWMVGHFRLGDLSLKADWKWNTKSIGNAAAFYASVENACNYIDALGLKIDSYSLVQGQPSAQFKAVTVAEEDADIEEEESLFRELPYRTANPRISRRRKASQSLAPEKSDWLIYIPFDPCDYRLGGSKLAEITGARPSTAPEVGDADYFIDCYEVVRELVEDGVVKAGATVGEGGLMKAIQSMTSGGTGAEICIRDICKAYDGENPVRVLFGEVPGVVIQIADIDYDYVDAELILQDVVYFPIGHPVPGSAEVKVSDKVEIPQILESLLNTLEGED